MKNINSNLIHNPETIIKMYEFWTQRIAETKDNNEKEAYLAELENLKSMMLLSSSISYDLLVDVYDELNPEKSSVEVDKTNTEKTQTTRQEVEKIIENASTATKKEESPFKDNLPNEVKKGEGGKVIQMKPGPTQTKDIKKEEEVPTTQGADSKETPELHWHDFRDNVKEIIRNAGKEEARSYVDDAFGGKLNLLDKHKKPINPEKWSVEKIDRWFNDVYNAVIAADKAAKAVEEKVAEKEKKGEAYKVETEKGSATKAVAGKPTEEITPKAGTTDKKKEEPVATAKPEPEKKEEVTAEMVSDQIVAISTDLSKFLKDKKNTQEQMKERVTLVKNKFNQVFTDDSVLTYLRILIDNDEANLSLLKYKESKTLSDVYAVLSGEESKEAPVQFKDDKKSEETTDEEAMTISGIRELGIEFISTAKTREEAWESVREVAKEYILNKDIPGMAVKFKTEQELKSITESLWKAKILEKFPLDINKDVDKAEAKKYVEEHAKKPGIAYYTSALKKYLGTQGFDVNLKEAKGIFENFNKEWKLPIQQKEAPKSASLLGEAPKSSTQDSQPTVKTETVTVTDDKAELKDKEPAAKADDDNSVNVVGWEAIEVTAALKPAYESIRQAKNKRSLRDSIIQALEKAGDRQLAYQATIKAMREAKSQYVKSVARMQVKQLIDFIGNIERKAS